MVAAVVNQKLQGMQRFYKFAESYMRRNNPVKVIIASILESIKGMLTLKKKAAMTKYRVNHMRYRIYQMEQIIEQGNPFNSQAGGNLDTQR